MVEQWAPKRVVIAPDATYLAEEVAERFVRRVRKRGRARKLTHVSLTGGSMGSAVLAAVARHPKAATIDWSNVHMWWSDERFVPRGHGDRNETQARLALLDHSQIPPENIHAILASDDGVTLDVAAERYADELALFGSRENPWPRFDISFLGVGPDGHIASLFPDRPEIRVLDRPVLAIRDAPKPPPERVTLTRPVINSSRRVWLVLAGEEKAPALGLALAGASYDNVPAGGAKGTKRTTFFVDTAAAANVPPELIER